MLFPFLHYRLESLEQYFWIFPTPLYNVRENHYIMWRQFGMQSPFFAEKTIASICLSPYFRCHCILNIKEEKFPSASLHSDCFLTMLVVPVLFINASCNRGPNPVVQACWRGKRGEHALAMSQVVGMIEVGLGWEEDPTSTSQACTKATHMKVGDQADGINKRD